MEFSPEMVRKGVLIKGHMMSLGKSSIDYNLRFNQKFGLKFSAFLVDVEEENSVKGQRVSKKQQWTCGNSLALLGTVSLESVMIKR